jgi:hypothetical protein
MRRTVVVALLLVRLADYGVAAGPENAAVSAVTRVLG